jgi:hypothetical protein
MRSREHSDSRFEKPLGRSDDVNKPIADHVEGVGHVLTVLKGFE